MVAKKKWIQDANIQPGGLHKSLGIPADSPIPSSALQVQPGDTPKVAKQKRLAKTFRKMKK